MKEKRVMVVGASPLQLPLIEKVKEKGYFLAVADMNKNAIGVKLADIFYEVSTTDEIGIYESAKEFQADAIVTIATDMPMRAIAYACEKLKLNSISYETAKNATDKGLMIKAFKKNSVPHPKFLIIGFNDDVDIYKRLIDQKIEFPCICKPTDSSGSRGVMLIEDQSQLFKAIKYSREYSKSGNIIVEELLSGLEISVETVIIKNQVHVLAITEKLTTGKPHFVELGHLEPARISCLIKKQVEVIAAKACQSLGIVNGVAHVEMMITDTGPKVIEVGARMGGDYITSDLVPLSTGIDMMDIMLKIALGDRIHIPKSLSKVSMIIYLVAKQGELVSIFGLDKVKEMRNVVKVNLNIEVGQKIGLIKSSSDRIGSVIICADSLDEALFSSELVKKTLRFEVK